MFDNINISTKDIITILIFVLSYFDNWINLYAFIIIPTGFML